MLTSFFTHTSFGAIIVDSGVCSVQRTLSQPNTPVKFYERRQRHDDGRRQHKPDDYWGGATTPRSAQGGASRGGDGRSRIQHGIGDNGYGKRTGSYGDARESEFKQSQSVLRQTPSHSAPADTPAPPAVSPAESQKTRVNTAKTQQKQQQQPVTVIPDKSHPLHMWYPAPVTIDGQTYHCAGQCLVYKAAAGEFRVMLGFTGFTVTWLSLRFVLVSPSTAGCQRQNDSHCSA